MPPPRDTPPYATECRACSSALLQIYERSDAFRQHISTLDLVSSMYNSIQATILDVEKPLVAQMLAAVEVALKKGSEVGQHVLMCSLLD